MSDKTLKTARIVSSIAATCISLACGTNVGQPFILLKLTLIKIVRLLSMGSPIRGEAQALIDGAEPDCKILGISFFYKT